MDSGTSSPALAGGPAPSVSPASPTTPTRGRSRARVSRFRWQDFSADPKTIDTSGRSPSDSSASACLQSCLESRLRARLESLGSPLYALTWNELAMPSGPPILQRRALARRTSGSESSSERSGYPTPTARDWRDGRSTAAATDPAGRPLNEVAMAVLAGYPTPRASDGAKGVCRTEAPTTGPDLPTVAGWATPTVSQAGGPAEQFLARKARTRAYGVAITDLGLQAQTWVASPDPGATSSGSPAPTGKRAQLNPAFTLWLMAIPAAWLWCAPASKPAPRSKKPTGTAGPASSKPAVTRSSRKRPRSSSEPSSTP